MSGPFRSVLIANRGEIAVRVIQACQELGLRAIAVYSDADSRALHVQRADASYRIGPPPARDSYLNVAALLEAARASGAEAVHPGYGFLAENADFAQACLDSGLRWVGPPTAAMRAMGNKRAAKRLMQQAGVAVVPGSSGELQDDLALVADAERIGYPLLVKAAAGGGGRGMRVVSDPGALAAALASARREAESAFGDGSLLLERYVDPARHVEVQVFADQSGRTVHLGERECSIQRRHQKVVEESPSPAVDEPLRARMGDAAVRAARAVGYVGAGTVEFVLDAQANYYFLEMNTRIQVEHPVTEMVTGLDLVKLQLRVAAGEPLPFEQDDVRWRGHAIECRVVAEDPRRGFAPQAGRLTVFEPPSGAGVRNDEGTYAGDEIGVHYDALLAKLIVHGRDRAEAIERMRWALDRYRVSGVQTNLELLRFVLGHPQFAAGRTFTSFLAEHWSPSPQDPLPTLEALLAAAAADLLHSGIERGMGATTTAPGDPWNTGGAWRLGRVGIPLDYLIGEHLTRVRADRDERIDGWRLSIDGEVHQVQIQWLTDERVSIRRGSTTFVASVRMDSDRVRVALEDGRAYAFERPAPPSLDAVQTASAGPATHGRIVSPMPAKVVQVLVGAGDRVAARQTLVVLESMKIEQSIEAPYPALVERVHCQAGDVIAEGAPLVELQAE